MLKTPLPLTYLNSESESLSPMKKADKELIAASELRFEWTCQQADKLFPPNAYQRNCLEQDGDVITVVRTSRYISEKIGCFKLPDISNFIHKTS